MPESVNNETFKHNLPCSGAAQATALEGPQVVRVMGSIPALRLSRNPGLSVLALLVVFYLAYQTAELILQGDTGTLTMVGIFIVGCTIIVAILNDWRRGLYLLFGWVMFEDLFRKYLGNNMAIFFGKDVLAIVLYLAFFAAKRKNLVKSFRPPFLVPLLVFFWFGFLQMFNPASTSIFFGILGMRLYFLYIPLMYVGYSLMESEQDLHKFFSFNCVLFLVVAGLGIAQAILGHTFLNPRILQEDIRDLSTLYRAAPISGAVAYRPNSVFVSHGRFANFLTVSWLVTLGFAGYLLLRSRRSRNLAFLTMGVIAIGSIMSASRSVFLYIVANGLVLAAAFLWGAPWKQGEVRRVLRTIQRTILVVGLALLAMLTLFPEELTSRFLIYSETLSPNSPASELAFRSGDYPLRNLMLAFEHPLWPYGYGIGTCSLGVQYVARVFHVPLMEIGVENGYGQLLIELGILGLFLWIFLSAAISLSVWRTARSLRGTPWFPLGSAISWYSFLLLVPMSYYTFVAYQDYLMNLYFWLLLGILYRLPAISEEALELQGAPQLASEPGQA